MTMRTSQRTVTFARPFRLGESGPEFPAGQYFIETDEELVDELSFPFYRRTATMMQLIADPLRPGVTETAVIDPLLLEAALEADAVYVETAIIGSPTIPGRAPEVGGSAEEPVAGAAMKAAAP
jgi:hypothetical protein